MTIPTGIRPLDNRLGGGLPDGSLCVITLPPGGEHLQLVQAVTRARGTLVLTTLKGKELLLDLFERAATNTDRLSIDNLDPGRAPETIPQELQRLSGDRSLFVSSIGPVEESVPTNKYIDMLNLIAGQLRDLQTTGYLLCYHEGDKSYNRIVTLDIADFVLKLRMRHDRDRVSQSLEIMKASRVSVDPDERVFIFSPE